MAQAESLQKLLQKAKQEISSLDAEILAQEIFSLSSSELFIQGEKIFLEELQKIFLEAVKKRKSGVPVSEILGKQNFFGREFIISNDVLTPRAETEVLVERVIECCAERSRTFSTSQSSVENCGMTGGKIIDIGTGSGAIIITLFLELIHRPARFLKPGRSEFIATDISEKALEVAKKNWEKMKRSRTISPSDSSSKISGMTEEVLEFRQSNLLENISKEEIKDSIIVTNLPYIPQKDSQWMETEVLEYDPELALFSGEEGLDLYKKFFVGLPNTFAAVFFEYDPPQTKFFQKFLSEKFPERKISFFADLNGDVRFGKIE
jgi:release factor glutamine methyltransferase